MHVRANGAHTRIRVLYLRGTERLVEEHSTSVEKIICLLFCAGSQHADTPAPSVCEGSTAADEAVIGYVVVEGIS